MSKLQETIVKKRGKVAPDDLVEGAEPQSTVEQTATRLSDTVSVTRSGAQFVTPVEIIQSPEGKEVLDRLYKQKPGLKKIKVQKGTAKTAKSTTAVAASLAVQKNK